MRTVRTLRRVLTAAAPASATTPTLPPPYGTNDETPAYYVAELDTVSDEVYGRSRPLSVRVSRPGITVRQQPEITFTDTSGAAAARMTIDDFLASTERVTDLPIRILGFTIQDPDGQLRVGVLLEPVDSTVTLRSAGAALVDGAGRIAAHWNARDATERPLVGAMTAAPGKYLVRGVAIDNAGRAGAAEMEMTVGLTQVGSLSLGSMLLSASRGGKTALQLEFGAEPTARASFDIYGASAGQKLSALLEIARDLDGPPIIRVPLTMTRASDTRVIATGTIPLGPMPPGDYVVRGIITLDDGTTGKVVRTLRKAVRP